MLAKGFEIEIYTGTPQGKIVGLSDKIAAALDGFMREPDSRNVEYTTPPICRYDRLLCELVRPRVRLRSYLEQLGGYTLVPGSTLALEGGDRFYRSDPGNAYHSYIENTYGTTVVTASVHINVGISDPALLMRACRLVRVEAPLYLALSAASPFFNGQVTGQNSTRWSVFPKTPAHVPLFTSHAHYIQWTEEQLALGTMQNVRHLWSAVRPNGDRRPYNLNRLELRICDLVTDPIALLAITALLEARIMQVMTDVSLDPLESSKFADQPDELVTLTDENETAAAHHGLEAELRHWQDGRSLTARSWIEEIYQSAWATAKEQGFSCFLLPLRKLLREGNQAQRWLKQIEQGLTVQQVMEQAIVDLAQQELVLAAEICQPLVA